MAFSYTLDAGPDVMGRGVVTGNFTASGVTAGVITTGLNQVIYVGFQNNVSATAVTSAASGGTVLLTCANGEAGTFFVYGE